MKKEILNKPITLVLNRCWQPVGWKTVKDAFLDFASDSDVLSMNMEYQLNDEGDIDFSEVKEMHPVDWKTWLELPIRDFDFFINTPFLKIRVPTILLLKNYSKIPKKIFRPTKKVIYERDKGKCQYSGKELSWKDASLDHLMPKSKGGKDTFDNLVLCDRKINSFKGSKTLQEAGLTLLKNPSKLDDVPMINLIKRANHPDWNFFLLK